MGIFQQDSGEIEVGLGSGVLFLGLGEMVVEATFLKEKDMGFNLQTLGFSQQNLRFWQAHTSSRQMNQSAGKPSNLKRHEWHLHVQLLLDGPFG